jgi:hypothetical protein
MKTRGSAANKIKISGITREDHGIEKLILDKKTYRGRGEDEFIKGAACPSHPTLQGIARRGLLVILGVDIEPGGSRPRSSRELNGLGLATHYAL